MANGKTKSQIFSQYLGEASDAVTSFVEDSQAKQRMQRRLALSRANSSGKDEAPKFTDILKEYEARVSLGKLEEKEIERKELGLTPLEYEKFKTGYEEDVKTGRKEHRTLQTTIATEQRKAFNASSAKAKSRDTAIAIQASKMEKSKIDEDIASGQGVLSGIGRGNVPTKDTTIETHTDIPMYTSREEQPKISEVGFSHSYDDIIDLVNSGEFQQENSNIVALSSGNKMYYIPKETYDDLRDRSFIGPKTGIFDRLDDSNALIIDRTTGEANLTIPVAQQLIFQYYKSPYGGKITGPFRLKIEEEEEEGDEITGGPQSLSGGFIGNNSKASVMNTLDSNSGIEQ
jgi:hypothetical protein